MRKIKISFLILCAFLLSGCMAVYDTPNSEEVVLTLAVFEGDARLRNSDLIKWVEQYNETHSDVRIEVVNYTEKYEDIQDALTGLQIEISAGKGPDMVNFGRQYSPLLASNGMMADLSPLLENTESYQGGDCACNVLDSFKIGESLYVLVPNYKIVSYTTTHPDLADLENMDIKQLENAYKSLDEKSVLFPGETKKSVFGMLCYGSMENYIDWSEGSCFFDEDSFKEVMLFADGFPLTLNLEEEYSPKDVFVEGKALLYPVSVEDVYGIAGVRAIYGKTPTYIGYPVDSGCGSMAAVEDIAIGISVSGKHPKESWDFISSLLEADFQDMIRQGLPVSKNILEKRIEEALRTETDENGDPVVKKQIFFEGAEPIRVVQITEEDTITLKNLINKISLSSTNDYYLYNILLEEADYFFNGDKGLDAVADVIQNRASLYISEQR